MLLNLCVQIADLHESLTHTLAQGRECDAREIADQIVQLEMQVLSLPASTLNDAAVKLQILKFDLDDHMTDSQRQAFEDAASVVSAKSAN